MMDIGPRTVDPRDLRSGDVLLDDNGVPFAVVLSRAVIGDAVVVNSGVYPDGSFDVRTFSSRPECTPTRGLASVETWSTYAMAVARAAYLNRVRKPEDRNIWHEYSAVYFPGTARRAGASAMPTYLPVEFESGMTASIVWMGDPE